MLGHSVDIHDGSVSVMGGAGLLILWLLLAGHGIRNLSARALLTLTGHLRPRPDPCLEGALRSAFAEFDRELSAVLHHSSPVRHVAHRLTPGSPSGLSR